MLHVYIIIVIIIIIIIIIIFIIIITTTFTHTNHKLMRAPKTIASLPVFSAYAGKIM